MILQSFLIIQKIKGQDCNVISKEMLLVNTNGQSRFELS
jgi:hypothetical protein